MADVTIDELIERTRIESGLRNNAYYDPTQILKYLNAGGAELQDLFTAANQHYIIDEFDFTTTGPSDAIVALPENFQQGHSLDIYPDTPGQTRTVRYLSNWLDRNKASGAAYILATGGTDPVYTFIGGNLRFYPPQVVPAAPFRLYYTPTWVDLAEPTTRQFTVDASDITEPFGWLFAAGNFVAGDVGGILTPSFTQSSRQFAVDAGDTIAGGIGFFLANANFTAADVGGTVTPNFAAPNTAWNVTWTIASVLNSTTVTTTPATGSLGSFTSPPSGTVTVSSLSNAAFNVPYTITAVLGGQDIEVTPDPQSLGTFATPPTGTVSLATPVAGTRAALPSIFAPWSEYLVVYSAIAINTDRQRGTGELERKLQALKARIASILDNRQEEPTQPPLTRGTGGNGWWSGGGWDGGGWL